MTKRAQDLAEFHPASKRHAFVEDDGISCWLYLTLPAADAKTAAPIDLDVFVYNHERLYDPQEIKSRFRDTQPPIIPNYASESALCDSSDDANWWFEWSADGESVAVV